MAKFSGLIGFGVAVEKSPGVWEDTVVERKYFGEVIKTNRNLQEGQEVNSNLTVTNSISIVADAYANNNFFAMRYVEWSGSLWIVSNVEAQRPRLILRLGGVYNGPVAASRSS